MSAAAAGDRGDAGDGRHHVVIIGCGFGGLFAAKALKREAVRVTLIDRTNHHLFQPLLYQVATGILSEGQIAPAIREVLRNHRSVNTVLAEVVRIDTEAHVVHADEFGRPLAVDYDSLIVAGGSTTSYFGHDEFRAYAKGMKSLDDALALRGQIFGAFECAEAEGDAETRRSLMTFVVIGGGPTGVEMAGQLVELSRRALRRNYRRIDPGAARVVLVEGGDGLVAQMGGRLSRMAARDLGSARGGDPPRRDGHRHGRATSWRSPRRTATSSASPPPPGSGRQAPEPRDWAGSCPGRTEWSWTRRAGSWWHPTARSPGTPRSSWSGT